MQVQLYTLKYTYKGDYSLKCTTECGGAVYRRTSFPDELRDSERLVHLVVAK